MDKYVPAAAVRHYKAISLGSLNHFTFPIAKSISPKTSNSGIRSMNINLIFDDYKGWRRITTSVTPNISADHSAELNTPEPISDNRTTTTSEDDDLRVMLRQMRV
jgi:hypothetical protein